MSRTLFMSGTLELGHGGPVNCLSFTTLLHRVTSGLPEERINDWFWLTAAHNDCTPTDQCIASTTQPLQQPDRFFPTISGCGSSVTSVAAMAQVQGAAASGEGNAQR